MGEPYETHEARKLRIKIDDVDLAAESSAYAGWREAFTIFEKYRPDAKWDIDAEHDVVYAGPAPCLVSDADLLRLAALGWHDSSSERFEKFT